MLVREYRKGKRFVLIIDEAQNLDNSVLEVVRMLSNFENSAQKLIQIILVRTAATRPQTGIAGNGAAQAAAFHGCASEAFQSRRDQPVH